MYVQVEMDGKTMIGELPQPWLLCHDIDISQGLFSYSPDEDGNVYPVQELVSLLLPSQHLE